MMINGGAMEMVVQLCAVVISAAVVHTLLNLTGHAKTLFRLFSSKGWRKSRIPSESVRSRLLSLPRDQRDKILQQAALSLKDDYDTNPELNSFGAIDRIGVRRQRGDKNDRNNKE